jgi:hypothetical protein
MRLTKSLMKLEEQNKNTINNNMKGSQLMTFRMNFVFYFKSGTGLSLADAPFLFSVQVIETSILID